jgi:multiple antibiotic resistance protein
MDTQAVFETAIIALATFFATIGPLDVAAVYAALSSNFDSNLRKLMAVRGVVIATIILLIFAFFGEFFLSYMGISLPAFRTAGGILLLLIGIEMVFVQSSGGASTIHEEEVEAATRQDIAVFPLATPLIAGPGAIGAAILLMANTDGDILLQVAVVASLLVILLFTLAALLIASQIQQFLGVTGQNVISRILGVLLSALAVQFIFDGIKQSDLFGSG